MTKTCQCCGTECDAEARVCPACGEASWSVATVMSAVPEPVEVAAPRTSKRPRGKVVEE
jgi:RNA polymerase subunit RPABC4/transcription elongation factor Spt4